MLPIPGFAWADSGDAHWSLSNLFGLASPSVQRAHQVPPPRGRLAQTREDDVGRLEQGVHKVYLCPFPSCRPAVRLSQSGNIHRHRPMRQVSSEPSSARVRVDHPKASALKVFRPSQRARAGTSSACPPSPPSPISSAPPPLPPSRVRVHSGGCTKHKMPSAARLVSAPSPVCAHSQFPDVDARFSLPHIRSEEACA